jgi:hypothetical protein
MTSTQEKREMKEETRVMQGAGGSQKRKRSKAALLRRSCFIRAARRFAMNVQICSICGWVENPTSRKIGEKWGTPFQFASHFIFA